MSLHPEWTFSSVFPHLLRLIYLPFSVSFNRFPFPTINFTFLSRLGAHQPLPLTLSPRNPWFLHIFSSPSCTRRSSPPLCYGPFGQHSRLNSRCAALNDDQHHTLTFPWAANGPIIAETFLHPAFPLFSKLFFSVFQATKLLCVLNNLLQKDVYAHKHKCALTDIMFYCFSIRADAKTWYKPQKITVCLGQMYFSCHLSICSAPCQAARPPSPPHCPVFLFF